MRPYDYLIVGAGLFGSTFAYFARKRGKRCLVIDKRPHLGGNIYCEENEGINVHKYGAHIFHTSNKEVWNFVNSIVEFNRYTNSPVANYQGKLYNLPFNMNTFYQMWGVRTPEEAKAKIEEQKAECNGGYESRRGERTPELGGAGVDLDREGHLCALDQGLYREAMGAEVHGASRLYHQASARSLRVRQ